MSRQTPMKRIWRCRVCNNKTHRRYWENNRCPVCGESVGHAESTHGGLDENQIRERRSKLKRDLENRVEDLDEVQQRQLDWLKERAGDEG